MTDSASLCLYMVYLQCTGRVFGFIVMLKNEVLHGGSKSDGPIVHS